MSCRAFLIKRGWGIVPLLLLAALCSASSRGAELVTLAQKSIKGTLIGLSAKEAILRADEGGAAVSVPLPDILQIDLLPSTPPPVSLKYTDIELSDGTLLHCGPITFKGKNLIATLLTPEGAHKAAQNVEIPLAGIRYVLADAQDATIRQDWLANYVGKKRNQDLLVVRKDGVPQPLEGTLGDGDETGEKIQFHTGGKTYAVGLNRIHGLVFFQKPNAELPASICRVTDLFRNSFAARSTELTEDVLTLTTPTGVRVTLPRALVARLDFSSDKFAYLSNLEPVKVEEKGTLGWVDHYGKDKNIDNGPIRLGGKVYPKGISLHAPTELTYDLESKFKEFKAVIGVDEGVEGDQRVLDQGESRVVLRIEGDGRELISLTISRKDAPRPVTLDVKGIKFLRVGVRSPDALDLRLHVDLADAQVSK